MTETVEQRALAAIDQVLADQPEKVADDFSAATRCLAAWRDELARQWRASAADTDRDALERLNAAISVVLGGQFPLGQVPWREIELARRDLGELADQRSADVGSHTT